ncbi:hypothetical protein NLJ89_g2668 [Agrocybe chaxingu]|uniref:F-box domain-containing protein n=1 Tax=Agrocybe chaxingu TaxID=84603 RepID=A0A9W8K5G9_9AGAR|nr:hypothetical protein NLJ89_g2668 [Agrocybe chaxingu]
MPTPDLPVELWLEILGLLPRSTLHKMIGINRTLFELALDDIYREIRFINDDKEMVKSFKQLKHTNIANRVQHLFIRPAFLPGMDEDEQRGSFRKILSSGLTCVKSCLGITSGSEAPEVAPPSPSSKILEAASKAVKLCPNLREITIVLYDHALTAAFAVFLNSMWSLDSVAPNLLKLNIDTTLVKIPLLLNPLILCAEQLTNLEEIDITLSVTRFRQPEEEYRRAKLAIQSFLTVFKGTIRSVTLSSSLIVDLSSLYDGFPILTKLRKFDLRAIFRNETLPDVGSLTRFLSKHASTLEHLVVKTRPRAATIERSDETYIKWLNPIGKPASGKQHGFPQLVLPALRSLDISLRESDQLGMWPYTPESTPKQRPPLPPLSRVTPNITSLTLQDVRLTFARVSEVVKSLRRREGGTILESLNVSVDVLTPQFFDLFSSELPRLRSLTVDHIDLSSSVGEYVLRDAVSHSHPFFELATDFPLPSPVDLLSQRHPGSQIPQLAVALPPGDEALVLKLFSSTP